MEVATNAGGNGQLSESDLKKFMAQVKTEMIQICSGADIKKSTEKVVEWYNSAPHRIVKLLCYPLLKNLEDADLSGIVSTLVQDLTSKDDEIQLNAMKLLYLLRHDQALILLKTNAPLLMNILKSPELNFERILLLHDFLMKAYIKSGSAEEDCREKVSVYYLAIAEQLFGPNRDLTRNAIEVFISLYGIYEGNCSPVQTQDHYFEGRSVRLQLQPLIVKITNCLAGRLESILTKIISYEVRLRSHLIKLIVSLLNVCIKLSDDLYGFRGDCAESQFISENYALSTKHGKPLSIKEFLSRFLHKHLIKDILLATHELDVLTNAYLAVFSVCFLSEQRPSLVPFHLRCKVLWDVFLHFSTLLGQQAYRKEYNVFLLNFASLAAKTSLAAKITISMRILEITVLNVSSQFSRFYLMLGCFLNLITSSIELLSIDRPSCIFSLFSQPWFLSKINATDPEEDKDAQQQGNSQTIKEEILISLTSAVLYARRNLFQNSPAKRVFLDKISLEVMDVGSRIINWKQQQTRDAVGKTVSLAVDSYLLLLEESINFLEGRELGLRVGEIVKRINLGEMSFLPRLKCTFLILKNFNKDWCSSVAGQVDIDFALRDMRMFLLPSQLPVFFFTNFFENISNLSPVNRYLIHLEYVLCCLGFFVVSRPSIRQISSSVITLLLEFQAQLSTFVSQQGIFIPFLEAISQPVACLKDIISEICRQNAPSIIEDAKIEDKIESSETNEHLEIKQNDNSDTNHQEDEPNVDVNPETVPKLEEPDTDKQTIVQEQQQQSQLSNTNETKNTDQLVSRESMHISRQFFASIEAEPSDKTTLQESEPQDIFQLSFNAFCDSFNDDRGVFLSDHIESANILKIISQISLKNTSAQGISSQRFISGLADCLQVYASHATYNYKQLLAIHLKIFNQTPFRICNVKVRVMHSNGLAIFPQESNPKVYTIEEINPLHVKNLNFCLNVRVVESELISFEVTVGETRFKTLPYKVGLHSFIVPNRITQLSPYLFCSLWDDLGYSFEKTAKIATSTIQLFRSMANSNFSCLVIKGLSPDRSEILFEKKKVVSSADQESNNYSSEDQLFEEQDNQIQEILSEIKEDESLVVGMLGWTWEGVTVAIRISGIQQLYNRQKENKEQEDYQQIQLEFRASKCSVVEMISQDSEDFISNVFNNALIS